MIHGGGEHIGTSRSNLAEKLRTKEVDVERFRRKDDWKTLLQKRLGEQYDVLAPRMPVADDPQYHEWEAWFANFSKLLDADAIYVGHSLGALFLTKYFAENPETSAKALFLIAAPYRVAADEDWSQTGFVLPEDISVLDDQPHVVYYHSTDDVVVPFEDFEQYQRQVTGAVFKRMEGRNHFFEDNFPEIVEDIKNL